MYWEVACLKRVLSKKFPDNKLSRYFNYIGDWEDVLYNGILTELFFKTISLKITPESCVVWKQRMPKWSQSFPETTKFNSSDVSNEKKKVQNLS